MASLIRPLSRAMVSMKQANKLGLVSAMQQRFKSETKQTDSLQKPIDKKALDPLADPKETCTCCMPTWLVVNLFN